MVRSPAVVGSSSSCRAAEAAEAAAVLFATGTCSFFLLLLCTASSCGWLLRAEACWLQRPAVAAAVGQQQLRPSSSGPFRATTTKYCSSGAGLSATGTSAAAAVASRRTRAWPSCTAISVLSAQQQQQQQQEEVVVMAVEGEVVEERPEEALATTNTAIIDDEDETVEEEEEEEEVDAKSAFGTKEYWDDTYDGRGDLPGDEYSWYYGWEKIRPHVQPHISSSSAASSKRGDRILIPGVGNDPILLDMLSAGYTELTAQDYSQHAIERQRDLLSYHRGGGGVSLSCGDVRKLPAEWRENPFDVIIEKGLLDAVYLSGDGQVERAVRSLSRALKPGGIFVSISGVVPDDLRRRMFDYRDDADSVNDGKDAAGREWTWIRDGAGDLQAGCFVFRKRKKSER